MAFGNEKFGNPLENQPVIKRKKGRTIKIIRNGVAEEIPIDDESIDKLKDPSKRKFLKQSLIVAGGVALAATGLNKLLDDDEEPKNKEWGPKESMKKKTKKEIEKNESKEHVVDRFERTIREKWMKSKRAEEIKKIKPKENMNPKEIAAELFRLFSDKKIRHELLRFFPAEVFQPDLFISQIYQESRGKKEAISKTGAKGVYQNFPGSVVDSVSYLGNMRRKGLIPYRGPSEINEVTAEKVINFFTKNGNYGRAAGKIYLQAIFNPVSAFNTDPNENVFRGKSKKDMQGRLLVSYHDGPSTRYKEDDGLVKAAKERAVKKGKKYDFRDSAVYYRNKVFEYMDDCKIVRETYKKLDFKLKYEDTAVDRMLHIFERYGAQARKEDLIIKFKDILKNEKDRKGRDLSRSEILNIFGKY